MRGPAGGACAVKSVPGAMTRCSNGDDDLGRHRQLGFSNEDWCALESRLIGRER